ncbi:MAG TPA: hypothetical protein VKR99_06865, partial [Candidatus Eremiobacteraceae bacterium]|nr:hypothetical protein [Candidatus Eremiobacteraceae bacterium]
MKRFAPLWCAIFLAALPSPAHALPVFAHRYGFSCETCHTVVPQLNPFGQAFLRAGFRIPNLRANGWVFPVAVKTNIAYSSLNTPDNLPKIILDELEFLAGGPLGKQFSYRLEQYGIDG